MSSDKTLDISVVITTYRRPVMLDELLDALHPQIKGRAAEIVIVDNCPDASARVTAERFATPQIRYAHEARSGVVFARNRGVAEARGTYVVFLDDDEVPVAQWFDAWLAQANGRTDASFGRIVPRLLGPCPPELAPQVNRNFSRDLRKSSGTDVSDYSAYLGTGNAMFHKARCLGKSDPFDLRFNARGGEDVWLVRGLVKQGRRLLWNHEALVEEQVPENRMTLASLELRRFNQGQIRCILMYGDGGLLGMVRVAIWMLVGAVQFFGFSIAARLAQLMGASTASDFRCRAHGGAGKILWWRQPRTNGYGSSESTLSAASSS